MGPDNSPVRVVLAEDQAMIRDAFAQLLGLQPGIDVVATVADGHAAMAAIAHHEPDIVLTDIEMPGATGLDLAERIQQQELDCRVVIVTTFQRPGYLRRALAAGVAGYVLKAAPIEDLVQALRTVRDGGRVIDPELAVQAWEATVELTDRERDVLRAVERGLSGREIAADLHLAEGTVRNYLSEACTKLAVSSRAQAATKARNLGLL
ncbi:response regulator transcription factor [Euzebya tangerina]|uniref:response regulator transcription factor n=1 Tax=Euzebya tangerina TaxID=591198 RepID=UPI00196B4E59|nr:response regulator transcription factor [Euzebya tangerina]